MIFVIVTVPTAKFKGIVVADSKSQIPVYTTEFWVDSLLLEVEKVMTKFNVKEVILLGPADYTSGLAVMIKEKYDIKISCEKLGR